MPSPFLPRPYAGPHPCATTGDPGAARWRRGVAAVLGILVAALGVVAVGAATAPSASAHSALIESDPDDGAVLETAPQQVTLTFNENLQTEFAVLTVVGPDGNFWQDGEPAVDGRQVSVPLRELGPSGEYEINYRVTSADGHPVEGRRTFEVTSTGSGTPGPVADVSDTADGGGTPLWPFLVGGVVVVVVGVGMVFWLARRSSR